MAAGIPLGIIEHVYDPSVTFQQGHLNTGESLPPQKPKKKYEQQKVLVYDQAPQELKQEKILAKIQAGVDGRQRISQTTSWPNTIHAQLTMIFDGKTYGGSCVIVGPIHALTCGHNVYDPNEKKWAERITVFPGLNDDHAPFGEAKVVKVYVYSKWTNEGDKQFDIALLIVNPAIGKYTGWGGILSLSDQEVTKEEVHITGYPGDKGLKQMWSMSHKVKSVAAEEFEYEIDTYAGQSGSAIWVNKWSMPLIVGVHTLGGDAKNSGVRLSTSKLVNLIAIISSTYKINKSNPALLALTQVPSPVNPAPALSRKKVPLNREGRGRALLEAAAQGDQAFLEQLLAQDTDVNAKNLKGETPLMRACENGHEQIAITLIENGADINAERENGERAIEIATKRGLPDLVHRLVDERANLFKEAKVGGNGNLPAFELKYLTCPAFIIAASSGNLPLLNFFIEHGVSLFESDGYETLLDSQGRGYTRPCFRGGKALVAACENGHEPVARKLLEMIYELPSIDDESKLIFLASALVAASRGKQDKIIPILLETKKLSFGHIWQAMQVASGQKDWKTVFLFLDNGFDINFIVAREGSDWRYDNHTTAGESLLISACHEGEIEIIGLFLQKGVNLKRIMSTSRAEKWIIKHHPNGDGYQEKTYELETFSVGAAAFEVSTKEDVRQMLMQNGAVFGRQRVPLSS